MPHPFDGKIIIIGTGPGALSCAYKLLLNKIEPVIIDNNSLPGGFMRSINYKDYTVDLGRKELYSRIPVVNEFWETLLGHEYVEYDYRVGVLYDGKILEKSNKHLGIRRGLSLPKFILCVFDYLVSKWRFKKPDNYQDFKYNSQGKMMTQIFGQGFYERFTGRKWADLPLPIDHKKKKSVIYNIFKFFFGHGDESSSQLKWRHPVKGSGQIISKLLENIKGLKGEVLYDVEIKNIDLKDDKIISLECKIDNKLEKIFPKIIVSSIPLEVLYNIIFKYIPYKKEENISARRGTLLVYLFLNIETKIENTWINVSCPSLKIGRITNYKSFNGEMVPKGKTCFCVEYFLNSDDDLFDDTENEILEKTYVECSSINLFKKRDLEHFLVFKLKNANAAVSWEDFINDPAKVKLYEDLKMINNLYNINRAGTDCATYAGLLASESIQSKDKDSFERFTNPTSIDPWNNP